MAWLLIGALLLTVILPAHYHLHHLHELDAASHAHTIDLHLITDTRGHAHHQENTRIIAATPDVIVNKDKPVISPLLPLAIFLVMLLAGRDPVRAGHDRSDRSIIRPGAYFSPPLRAPPQRR